MTRHGGIAHRGLQTIVVLSRIVNFDSTIIIPFVKFSTVKYIHFVYPASVRVVMAELQYTASFNLIVRPVPEETLRVLTPF